MNKNITIRGIDNKEAEKESHSIRNYILDKFAKIDNLLESEKQPINIDVVVTVVKPHPAHQIEIRIRAPHYHVIVQRENPELYKAIDEALDVAWEQVAKEKRERVDNERKAGLEYKEKDRFGN